MSVRRLAVLAVASALLTGSGEAHAQGSPREIVGSVRHTVGGRDAPVPGQWTTLHRVGRDHSGPVDSVRTDAGGNFRFRWRQLADSALWFVSTSYAGIAYFTAPLRDARTSGEAATLLVYDTTSAAIPITLRGRHVVLTEPDSGARGERTVIEVYELSNDSTLTRVPGARQLVLFESRLPDGARSPRVGQGDLSSDAVQFEGTVLRVRAPIAPGLKQFSVSYLLPDDVRDVRLPVPAQTPVLEVLVEAKAARVTGGGMRTQPAAAVGGREFQRFLGDEVPAAAPVTIEFPGGGPMMSMRVALVVTVIGAAVLLGLAGGFLRRGGLPAARAASAATDDPDTLAREIAALDAAYEARTAPSTDDKAAHYQRRAQLKARLTAALARRDGLQ